MKAKNVIQAVLQQNKGLSSYDVWVIVHKEIYDIDEIYMNKQEAEQVCKIRNENYNDYFIHNKKVNFYVVSSLSDAIYMIKDNIENNTIFPEE